jgi:hypothetical protein
MAYATMKKNVIDAETAARFYEGERVSYALIKDEPENSPFKYWVWRKSGSVGDRCAVYEDDIEIDQ